MLSQPFNLANRIQNLNNLTFFFKLNTNLRNFLKNPNFNPSINILLFFFKLKLLYIETSVKIQISSHHHP